MTSAPASIEQHKVNTAANREITHTSRLSSDSCHGQLRDSEELYRINGWGEPYFSINAAGHVIVSPQGDRGGSLNLHELIQALQGYANYPYPFLFVFPTFWKIALNDSILVLPKPLLSMAMTVVIGGYFPSNVTSSAI